MRTFYLPFIDFVRSMGVTTYLMQILFHDPLSALILFLMMNPALSSSWNFALLGESYVYFVPYFALLAGVGTFENEHFVGVSEYLAQRPWFTWATRLPFLIAQTLLPILFFSALVVIYLPNGLIQLACLLCYWLVFSSLGIFFALNWGFRKEKSINNVLSLIPWILALGPGPFLAKQHYPWFMLFPGAGMRDGRYAIEAVKLALYLVLALTLAWRAQRPRKQSLFRLGA